MNGITIALYVRDKCSKCIRRDKCSVSDSEILLCAICAYFKGEDQKEAILHDPTYAECLSKRKDGAGMVEKELTQRQIDRQDAVDSTIAGMLLDLAPEGSDIEWDEEWGGEIRDIIKEVIVDKLHLMTEMEFYPYIEREEEPAANTVSEAEELSDAEVELIASGYEREYIMVLQSRKE